MEYSSKSRNLCSKQWIAFTQNMHPMDSQGVLASHSKFSAGWPQSSQPPGWGAHLGLAAWFQPQVSILLKQEKESCHPQPSCIPTLCYFGTIAASISQLPGLALWAAVLLQKSHCTVPLIHQGDSRHGTHHVGQLPMCLGQSCSQQRQSWSPDCLKPLDSWQEVTLAVKSFHPRASVGSSAALCWAAVQWCELRYISWCWINDWWGSGRVQ